MDPSQFLGSGVHAFRQKIGMAPPFLQMIGLPAKKPH
jgi:hypothetical protein